MRVILNKLFEREILSKKEAKEVLYSICNNGYNLSQITAFITVYCLRSITVEELDGFREAMLEMCLKVELDGDDIIDVCGTGGDGKDTFNISTLSTFVIAGAGYKVAKHGNYGVSSGCGSSNVMEHLGYTFTNDISKLKRQFDKSGVCFLHAPLFHPAMKTVAPIRKDLGVKTFFNMLGPLVNPASPSCQCSGVFSLDLARLYAYLFQNIDKKFSIVYDLGGYDEISLTNDIKLYNNVGEFLLPLKKLTQSQIKAEDLSSGSNIDDAAKIFMDVLNNKSTKAQKEVVISNSAIAIQTIENTKSYEECIELAQMSLERGNALDCFKNLLNEN